MYKPPSLFNMPCSFCKTSGHNVLTCDHPDLRNFELDCVQICQELNSRLEFRNRLKNIYSDSVEILQAYVAKKCRIRLTSVDELIDTIINYIYDNYNFNDTYEEEMEVDVEIINILTRMMNPNEDVDHSSLESSLINDIVSGVLFASISAQADQNRRLNIEITLDEQEGNVYEKECDICYENCSCDTFVTLNCKHDFCLSCIKKSFAADKREKPCCALCRTEINHFTSINMSTHCELSQWVKTMKR